MSNTSTLPTCVNVPLEQNELTEIVTKAKDWAIMHGISMRSKKNFSEDVVQISPFVLLPTAFPRKEFNKVKELETTIQELLHKIAHNRDFLRSCYKNIVEADDFSARLYKIYETVQDEGPAQKKCMLHNRTDYLLQSPSHTLKNVEFNTIASSFASLSTLVAKYNRYILEELGHYDKVQNIPENPALTCIAQGFIDAWKLHGNPDSVILFIAFPVTVNITDQRLIEFEIKRLSPQTKVIRKTFAEVKTHGQLNNRKDLVIDNKVVAVVYFREGYVPEHYPTDVEWDARLMIERSTAIKCPDIKYHLVGQKKVQQELTKPGVLELFLTETKKIEAVREIFVNIYGLEFDENGDRTVQMAMEHPERYVLKPQREGGGNNYYDNDIRELLEKIKDSKERTSYILMERIYPPTTSGYMVLPEQSNPPPLVNIVSELGIFGVIISEPEGIIINRQAGHMIRSKAVTSNEGGVLAGAGALDCPYLY